MAQFRKKPVVIEAVRVDEVLSAADAGDARDKWPPWILGAFESGTLGLKLDAIVIPTLEGR